MEFTLTVGFTLSAAASDADAAVAKALGAAPAGEFAHVAKWYSSVNK